MTELDRQELNKIIVQFATRGVDKFLQEHRGLTFYAFAFDCNAECAEINLCFNTEANFSKTFLEYKSKNPSAYEKEDEIRDLRYNTGDWEYQCFDTIFVLSENELKKIFQAMPEDNYQTWHQFVNGLMVIFAEALRDFTKTEIYNAIAKTSDFIAFCIDHDESFEEALNRMRKYA